MAKKSSAAGMTFREIMTAINHGTFAPVYILMGDEPYYLDRITDALEQQVVSPEDRDFNSYIYYGADAQIDVVAAAAQQYPVMAPRQLVILKEAQGMAQAKSALDKLAPYVSRPTLTTVFAIVYKGETLNATSQLIKAANASGALIFKSQKLRDYQMATPIKDYCASKGVGIDDKSVGMLVEYLGTTLSKVFGEIDKLIVAGGENVKRISPLLIEENIGISKDFNNFELTNAIVSRDYPKAMRIVDYFSRNPKTNPTVITSSMLFNLFTKIITILFLKDKSDASIMQALQLKSAYQLKDLKAGLAAYPGDRSLKIVSAIREFDCKSKGIGSFQNEYELLKELIFKIFTV